MLRLQGDCADWQQEQGCRRAAHADRGGTMEGNYGDCHGGTSLAGDHRRVSSITQIKERYERSIKGITAEQEVLDTVSGYGRLAGAVFRGEICQSIIGRGCEDGHRVVATAGDGDHRCDLNRRFGGDESSGGITGREVKEKGLN